MTDKRQCSCAVCMGFEPWVTDFAGCMIERFIATGKAVEAGEACSITEGHASTCMHRAVNGRTVQDAIAEMNAWHARWSWA